MSAVRVRLLSGGHRTPDGIHHRPDDADPTFVEGRAVYEVFKFKFELLGSVNGPAPKPPMALPSNATPGALELIESEGVDWAHIKGSGKSGRILESDVEEYLDMGPQDVSAQLAKLQKENAGLRAALEARQLPGRTPGVRTPDEPVVVEAEFAPNATDAAIEFARREGVDLNTVTGTGRGGIIKLGDVQAAAG